MSKFHYKDSPSPKQNKTFEKYLSEDEELVLVTGLSGAYLRQEAIIYFIFPGIIFGAISGLFVWMLHLDMWWTLGTALTMMAITSILKTLHLHHANRYLLTTRRVMIKKGLFAVKLTTALFDKITHIEVDQGLIDRLLLHHGSIIVNTAGMNKNEFIMQFVDYPMELKNILERLINREREQLGKKYEPLSAVEGEIVD